MDKRYQVFVSSTYMDLREERKAIMQVLLISNFIPAGMEHFYASTDKQFEYIKRVIDNCDYYVLVIAAKYGSSNKRSGLSYTEREYDYAVLKGIPVIAFLHDDPNNLPENKRDDDKRDLLDAFRKKVSENRMCKEWHTQSDLVGSVSVSLHELIISNPRPGWMRGGEYDNTDLLEQINTIRIDKEKLENEIDRLNSIIKANDVKVDNLAKGSDLFVISGMQKYREGSQVRKKEVKIELSWDSIFSIIGPHLSSPIDFRWYKIQLKDAINSKCGTSYYEIKDDCAQIIKIQFLALGFIEAKAHGDDQGVSEQIYLTSKGLSYLMKIKTVKENA